VRLTPCEQAYLHNRPVRLTRCDHAPDVVPGSQVRYPNQLLAIKISNVY
jgi:hypothetical protein